MESSQEFRTPKENYWTSFSYFAVELFSYFSLDIEYIRLQNDTIFFLFSYGHFEDVRLAAIDCLVDLTKSEF